MAIPEQIKEWLKDDGAGYIILQRATLGTMLHLLDVVINCAPRGARNAQEHLELDAIAQEIRNKMGEPRRGVTPGKASAGDGV